MTQCLTAFGCDFRQQVEALLPEVPADHKGALDSEPAHETKLRPWRHEVSTALTAAA